MTRHVVDWLGAYHDGEITAHQRHQVEIHLLECSACRTELDHLQALTALLAQSPAPQNLTPAELLVTAVRLRLRPRPEQATWQRALRWGWRLVPFALLGTLALFQAGFLVAAVVEAALELGWGGGMLAPLFPAAAGNWGLELGWIWTQNALFLVSVALLYWGWLASWLALRRRGALQRQKDAFAAT